MGVCEIDEYGGYVISIFDVTEITERVQRFIWAALFLSVLCALIFFFIIRRKLEKPRFVKVIFLLLGFIMLLPIGIVLVRRHMRLENKKTRTDVIVNTTLVTTISTLSSICHWIFASKYFELALFLPIYLGFVPNEHAERKQRRNSRIILIVNAIFYITAFSIFIFHILETTMGTLESESVTQVPDDIGAVLKIMAACILIFSIFRIRSSIKKLESNRLSTREALMTWHTICYVLVILLNIYAASVNRVVT